MGAAEGEDERPLLHRAEGVEDGRPRPLEGEGAVPGMHHHEEEAEVEGDSGDRGRRGGLPLSGVC